MRSRLKGFSRGGCGALRPLGQAGRYFCCVTHANRARREQDRQLLDAAAVAVARHWAHERPLVAARAKGPEWLVDDGENGLLFPVDDVSACAAAIQRLIDDPKLAERLVAGGRAKWQRSFSREAVVRQYLELFERLRSG